MIKNIEYIKGPSFYKEEDQYIFWGRNEEIQDVYYLVSNSDFSICYAKSGEGKSSLLNAGLIPMLRKKNFLPICIRFTPSNYKEENPNFDKIIGRLLEETINNLGNGSVYKSMDIDKEFGSLSYDGKPLCNTLWWKLRVNEIRKDAFTQLTPVLIFDQFEEVFTCSENIEWVSRFFAWLECLYNDKNPLDDANIGRLPKKFKVLLSLRSEYVCELDYWSMQRYFIPSLKNNRYYLKALTENNAEEIADRILDKANIDHISKDEVLRFSQNEDTDKSYKDKPCKSALKLSLILDTYYRHNEKVKELINEKGNALSLSDILEIYYDESTKELPREKRNKLEDLLVDSNGRRTKVSIADISAKTKISENQLERLKEKRIITTTNSNDIEIAHDCMCDIVSKHSAERRKILEQERIQALKNKWFVMIFVLLSICGVALFFCIHTLEYSAMIENYRTSKNLVLSLKGTLFSWTGLLCLSPYLLPLTAIGIYCRVKKGVKEYVKTTDILSVVCGTLFIIAACFLRDTIFCNTIGTPNLYDSIWYAVVPLLLYLSCILYLWESLNIKRKTIFCYLGIISMFSIIEISNVLFNRFTFMGLGLVSIGMLVVTFKKLSVKGCVFYVTMNTLVLAASIIAHLGFCPWKIINYSVVKAYSKPWKCIIIENNKMYGMVDAITGDTIVPCMFDSITKDGFVMLLSPTCEELYDLPLDVTNKKSVISSLKERGNYGKLNNKDCIRYIWEADKKLYTISKEDTIYKGKAANAYFAVRNELYKAIKQNTPINKINTKLLETLYKQESDSINTFNDSLSISPSDKNVDLLITHTTRQMAIASILDMVNDNRSKLSLCTALWAYTISYFSKELHDERLSFKANVNFKYNEISNDSTRTEKFSNILSLNTKYSNDDSSMLGTWTLWQYVYINTLSLIVPLYANDLKSNLPSIVSNLLEEKNYLIEKISNTYSYNNKDVENVLDKYKKNKDLATSINDVIHVKESNQLSLIDSLRTINDQYKSFNPYSVVNVNRLKKIRQTASENIKFFSTLYEALSSKNDYHYALCRQELIDNLRVAGFCGKDIIDNVGSLEKTDSSFFNYTYKEMKSTQGKVNEIRKRAKEWDDNDLTTIRTVLQNILKKQKLNVK